jgi:hypothetical protein
MYMYIKLHGLHLQHPLFSSNLNQNCIFSADFLKILKYQIPLKSFQWKTSWSMRTDGRTDRTKLTAAFRNYAKALKMGPNQMMTIRPQKQSENTGSADSVFDFNSVGDRSEYGQGHRPHLMGILVIKFMVYKTRSRQLRPYPLQFPVQLIIVLFSTISEGVAIWKKAEGQKYWIITNSIRQNSQNTSATRLYILIINYQQIRDQTKIHIK